MPGSLAGRVIAQSLRSARSLGYSGTIRRSSTLSRLPASKLVLPRVSTSSSILRNQVRTLATAQDTKEYTVREALNEALLEELEADSKVFILGEEGSCSRQGLDGGMVADPSCIV